MSNLPGEVAQRKVLEYIQANFDPDAFSYKVTDSTEPDIISNALGIVEAKQKNAQCGQFTITKLDENPLNYKVKNGFSELVDNAKLTDDAICKEWVMDHYKDAKYFGIYNPKTDTVTLQTAQEFFDTHIFSCTYRKKSSGSQDAAKWVEKYVPEEWKCERKEDGRLYADPSMKGQYGEGINTRGVLKTFWVSDRNIGEVRILSDTATPSFVFSFKEKKG